MQEEKQFPFAAHALRKKFLANSPATIKEVHSLETQTLGKFKILQRIGKGAAADVFLAEDTSINRRVALKVLTRFHPQDFERFKRESKVAAKLNHPSIVQLYEVGELESLNYISMQYIEGGSVADKNLTLVQALKVISAIARAVEYAHNQGVIHRDIKPANILVDHEGKCYLADFGIAKSLTLQSIGKTLSVTGMIIGTPNFMSPEQARGDITKVDFLSDVYSLGATLYYLLTGKEPYQGTSVMEIINKVINEEAPAPRSIKKDIPAEVEAIVLKAIEKDKQKRYQRAVDLARDIERSLRGEPIEAKVASLSTKIRKRLKKYKATIIIGVLVISVLSYLIISAVKQQSRFKDLKSQADSYFEKGELDKALEYYGRCLEIKDDNDVQSRISFINNKKQRQSHAQTALNNALTLYDRYKKILYDKTASVQEIRSIASEIEKYLTESIKEYPLSHAYYYRGKIHRELAEFEKAEKDLAEAINLDKNFDLARLERIKLYWDTYTTLHRFGWSAEHSIEAAKMFGEKIKRDLDEINSNKLPSVEVELMMSLLKVKSIAGDQEYYQVLKDLEQLYERFKDEEICYLIAVVYSIMRDFEKMNYYLSKAIEKRPFFPKAYFLKGRAIVGPGNFKEAIDDYTKAIEQAPSYNIAYLERALAYANTGEYEKAELDCKEFLKIGGSDYDYVAYDLLGAINLRKGLFDEALNYLNKSLSINSKWIEALINRSVVYREKNDIKSAFLDLNSALEIRPDYSKAYYQRGLLYLFYTKQYDSALHEFDKAIIYFKKYKYLYDLPHSFLYKGIAYFNLGKYDDALKDLNEAIKLDPSLESKARPYLDKIKDLRPDK